MPSFFLPKLYVGYEAPSTAYENLQEPLLIIEGVDTVPVRSMSSFLPEKLTLPVAITPIPYTPSHTLQVNGLLPCPLYENTEGIIQGLDLHQDGVGFYSLGGETHPLDPTSPYGLNLAQNLLYRHTFLVLTYSVSVVLDVQASESKVYPYGGKFMGNPVQGGQLYFYPTLSGGKSGYVLIEASEFNRHQKNINYFNSTQQEQPFSLDQTLKQGGVSLSVWYEDQPYPYRSYAYSGPFEGKLWISFVPHHRYHSRLSRYPS